VLLTWWLYCELGSVSCEVWKIIFLIIIGLGQGDTSELWSSMAQIFLQIIFNLLVNF